MIAVLNPARAVAADRLNMRPRVFGEAHIHVSGRNGKPFKAAELARIADGPAIARNVGESPTITAAADGKIGDVDFAEWLPQTTSRAEPALELSGRGVVPIVMTMHRGQAVKTETFPSFARGCRQSA
jgi:hypothetical protein